MFESWTDACIAVALVVSANRIAALLSMSAGNAQIALDLWLGEDFGNAPEHAEDTWSQSLGQRREDARRRRMRAWVVIAGIALAQLLPVSATTSAIAVFGLWVLVTVMQAGYDRLLVAIVPRFAEEENQGARVPELARDVTSTRTDPFSGGMRPLGLVAGASSLALVYIGWMGTLGAAGVAPLNLPNPLNAHIAAAPLVAIAGIATIFAARIPISLARRFALGRDRGSREFSVLYLRSFQDDGLVLPISGVSRGLIDRLTLKYTGRYEQLLVGAAQALGPVVAVGEPGERLPPLGAFRRYFTDDEWQEGVTKLLSSVDLVVMSLGETPSVAWEVDRIRELRLASRTVFVIPPVDREARSLRLRKLADALGLERALLDCEAFGVEILAVTVDRRGRPTIHTSRFRDYASYAGPVIGAALGRKLEFSAEPTPDTRRTSAPPASAADRARDAIVRKQTRLKWLQNRERDLRAADADELALRRISNQIAETTREIADLSSALDDSPP